jgi:hypothetical protein
MSFERFPDGDQLEPDPTENAADEHDKARNDDRVDYRNTGQSEYWILALRNAREQIVCDGGQENRNEVRRKSHTDAV